MFKKKAFQTENQGEKNLIGIFSLIPLFSQTCYVLCCDGKN